MSTNRARALEYSKSVAEARQNRKAKIPDNFGKPKPTGPPSYAFVDLQRTEVDNSADSTRRLRDEEKAIENDKEGDIVDKGSFKPATQTGKAVAPIRIAHDPVSETSELKSVFQKCWTTVDNINIPKLTYDEKSKFVPNAIALFEILHSIEETLNGNEELRWISPNYFSLPVRVYYAVIFYVQILRAKEQSGKLTKPEGSWLRAFFRRHKDVSCPIVGPLVPYFTNIVSVQPDDDQFQFVYPFAEEKGTYSVLTEDEKRVLRVRSQHYLTPSVPLIASLLRQFCHQRVLTAQSFDLDGNYIPFDLNTGGDFAGVTFPPNSGIIQNIASLLSNPVMSHPLPESKDRLVEIHQYWRRSGVKDIPDIPVNQNFDPSGPQDWTLMSTDFDWFEKCIEMATIQCKFFSESKNLSEIPVLGGLSALVVAELTLKTEDPPTTVTSWYPDLFKGVKATFKSTTAELHLDDTYEAAYALTNAILKWKVDSNGIGSLASGLRDGPFFQNTKVNFELSYEVKVINGIFSMIQTLFYNAHGKP